jgi:DNA-binding transcriptional LysR family regulator
MQRTIITAGPLPESAMDRIAAMNAFVRVVEAGTFTKAADTLDLPNATVTRLIQGLEDDLKVRLLHRTTRSLTLTTEGASYYERVVRLLADLADIESSTRQSLARPSGRIRVETSVSVGTLVIMPALPEFYRSYPDVSIELGVGNRQTDLVVEGVDCAIRMGEITDQSLVARRIGELEIMTCATPEFIQANGAPAAPDELRSYATIGLASWRAGRALPFRFAKGSESFELSLAHRLVVNDTNAYLVAALAGLGIVQVPSYAGHDAAKQGRLVSLLEDWRTTGFPVHMIYPPNRYLSAKVRVFIDWTIALFERHEHLRRRELVSRV